MTEYIPVLVGVSQILQRVDDPTAARPPLELMVEAVREAAADCGSYALLERASSIRVIKGIWGYRNPALGIAQALGLGNVETGISVIGGNHAQMVFNRSALDIQDGSRDIVILAGAECGRTLGRARKAGNWLGWRKQQDDDATPAANVEYGDGSWTRHEAEMALGLQRPVQYYSLFENALRYARGESIEEHLERISRLWAAFSDVAQGNPSAWIRRDVTAEEIRTLTPENPPITFPYPKLMNANVRVDMGAALILCSLDIARKFGVPEDKIVYPLAGTDACDHHFVSERDNLHSSPAIRIAGRGVLELADTEVRDLDFVDLYSCFPSAVQVAANELGLAHDRPLSVTGGLTFGGGPLNNYVMHSIARTAEVLRENPGSRALVTANGGMLTKHSFCVFGTERPEFGFRYADRQADVDAMPRRDFVVGYRGDAVIESYVVMFGGQAAKPTRSYTAIYAQPAEYAAEPSLAHLACRLDDGRRTWANIDDASVLEAMSHEEFCGRMVRIDGECKAVMT